MALSCRLPILYLPKVPGLQKEYDFARNITILSQILTMKLHTGIQENEPHLLVYAEDSWSVSQ